MPPLYLYIAGTILYFMVIHFAVGISKQFDGWFVFGIFILGGFLGYMLESYITGFVFAVIFTFLFW